MYGKQEIYRDNLLHHWHPFIFFPDRQNSASPNIYPILSNIVIEIDSTLSFRDGS